VHVLVTNVLERNKLEKEHIDLFIFHQANAYMLEFLRKKLKIDKDRFFLYLSDVGNTVSSTIPIALCEALKTGAFVQGMKVLLAGFGVGYSWGGCLLDYMP
jgi:3-oxoacyl-[acyl-carrier-protein] synthase-3